MDGALVMLVQITHVKSWIHPCSGYVVRFCVVICSMPSDVVELFLLLIGLIPAKLI